MRTAAVASVGELPIPSDGAAARCPSRPPVVTSVEKQGGCLARDDLIQIKGTITEALAGGNYRVKGDNGMDFLAKIGGRMRRYHIRVIPGDRVTIAVSPYDPTHGLIVFRGG
jgi:translation initiation factor IF-1